MASNHIVVVGVLVVSFGVPVGARADGAAGAGQAQILACQACHVTDATTGQPPPRLVGQRAGYLAKQLKAFRTGDRKNRVMNALARDLSDGEIDNLAAYWSAQPAGSDAIVPAEVAAIKKSKMMFPRDFPSGFVFYGTSKKPEAQMVSMAYVNLVGLQAAKAGTALPDGSVIILINYAAKLGADGAPITDPDGNWVAGEIKQYEGMEARAGWGKDIPELLRNVNWNYAMFSTDKTPRTEINQASCLACHKPAAETSFVFGLKKIQAKAGAK